MNLFRIVIGGLCYCKRVVQRCTSLRLFGALSMTAFLRLWRFWRQHGCGVWRAGRMAWHSEWVR